MGNQQSGNYQLTPEQYSQYQYFLQQQPQQYPQQQPQQYQQTQQYQHQQQPQQYPQQHQQPHQSPPQYPQTRQVNINQQSVPMRQPQQQNNGNHQKVPIPKKIVQTNFSQQQQDRTQVRIPNQNIDIKMIPNLQQKSQMPSVENSFQTAYNQRMSDNFNNMNYPQQSTANGFKQIPNYNRAQQPGFKKYKEEKDSKRQDFFNNLNSEIDEIEQLKYNPIQILGLTDGVQYTELDIKKAYRNLAIRYHPDKGGSEEVFKILTKAYMYLLKRAQGDNYVEKNFMDLKTNYDRETNTREGGINNDEFNVKNFNKIFDENKLEDEERDFGYGDWKTTDTSEEPAKIFNQKFTADIFNQVFNELKTNKAPAQDVIVYEEPRPLTTSNRLGFSDVDYKRSSDYSKEYDIQDGNSRQGIYYMDYKRAYTDTTLISPDAVKPRQEYKDIEDAQIAREKQDFTMTDEERAFYEEKKRKEDEYEVERLSRLRKRDDQLETHSSRVNRLLLGNQPQSTRSLDYQRR
jgi:curved DNA-binding protein CbpA